jgi:hypothetical protein
MGDAPVDVSTARPAVESRAHQAVSFLEDSAQLAVGDVGQAAPR